MFNKLDNDLYENLLTLKAKYNKYVPLRRNYGLLRDIAEDITKEIDSFRT